MDESMKIFYELHEKLPRQGPGDSTSTAKAYRLASSLPETPRILDVGCGSGIQTIELAKLSGGTVTGLDNHRPFLDKLLSEAAKSGLTGQIEAVEGAMEELPFKEESFDLIWSEGAIYIMGFEKGLAEWKRFLKPGGYISVSDMSWLVNPPPQEVLEYWQNEYPGLINVDEHLEIIEKQGYSPVGHFTLPASSWWESYYNPTIEVLKNLKEKYIGNPALEPVLLETESEIELFRNYSHSYGYVFYVMKF